MPASPLSILDRLTGVKAGFDPGRTRRNQVLADVRNLLNTRRAAEQVPKELKYSRTSILTYGLPDFSAMTIASSVDKNVIRKEIEQAIKNFEPRLDRARVSEADDEKKPDGEKKDLTGVLHFSIEAILLHEDGDRETIIFETHHDPRSRKFNIDVS